MNEQERKELATAYVNLINARSAVIGQLRREGKAQDANRLQRFNVIDSNVLKDLRTGSEPVKK